MTSRMKDFQLTSYSSAQFEALVGEICRHGESDPANPEGNHNVPDRYLPAAEKAQHVEKSYQ